MLKIWYGSCNGELEDFEYMKYPYVYFDNQYDVFRLEKDISKKIIKDVDGSEYIGGSIVSLPIFDKISVRDTSREVRTLITVDSLDEKIIFNVSNCGDNCAKWLLEIAKKKDVYVVLEYIMDFEINEDNKVMVLNTGNIYENSTDLENEAIDIVYSDKEMGYER